MMILKTHTSFRVSLKSFVLAAVALATPQVTALPVSAGEVAVTTETVAARINLAGRQRMLSQRMAKSFCFARSGVDVAANVDRLTSAMSLFKTTHQAFAHGNADMMVFEEGDASVIRTWRDVDLMWNPLENIYETALSGQLVSEEDFDQVMRLTPEVMSRSNDMVAQIRSAYADQIGSGGMGAALMIDLYGRQRMLSQKLSKEVCLVARGYEIDTLRSELKETIKLFDTSINAFVEGLPIAGITPPPTDGIGTQLRLARDYWTPVAPIARAVAEARSVSLSDLEKFNTAMDKFLPEMNKAVGMLEAYQSGAKS